MAYWKVSVDYKMTCTAVVEADTKEEAEERALRAEWEDTNFDEFLDVIAVGDAEPDDE